MTSVGNVPPGTVPNQTRVTDHHDGQVTYNGVKMSTFEAVSLLFIERAQEFSTLTGDQLKTAKDNLGSMKQARQYMQDMRNLKDKGGVQDIPEGMKEFCQAHDIQIPDDDDNRYSSSEFDTAITNMQGALDNFQDTNQIEMLKLKTRVNNMDTSITGASKNQEKIHSLAKDIISGLGR